MLRNVNTHAIFTIHYISCVVSLIFALGSNKIFIMIMFLSNILPNIFCADGTKICIKYITFYIIFANKVSIVPPCKILIVTRSPIGIIP